MPENHIQTDSSPHLFFLKIESPKTKEPSANLKDGVGQQI